MKKIFFMIYAVHEFENTLGFTDETLQEVQLAIADNAEQFHEYFNENYKTGHTFQQVDRGTVGVSEVMLSNHVALAKLKRTLLSTMSTVNCTIDDAVRYLLEDFEEKTFSDLSDSDLDKFCYVHELDPDREALLNLVRSVRG